jgi:hypothetical protein
VFAATKQNGNGTTFSGEPIAMEDWGMILNDDIVVSKLSFKDGDYILKV